jgi:hypothetical protein
VVQERHRAKVFYGGVPYILRLASLRFHSPSGLSHRESANDHPANLLA